MRSLMLFALVLCLGAVGRAETFAKRDFKIDESVNPCENFYDYVCKATDESFVLPKTRSHHTFSFDDASENLLSAKKEYFKKLQSSQPTSDREKQIQSFYIACMDEKAGKAAEQQYVAAVKQELKALETREQFAAFIFQKMKNGEPSFVSFSANLPNFKDNRRMDGYFTLDVLSMPEQTYYGKDEAKKDLQELLQSFFGNVKVENPAEQARWVYEFEMGLAKAIPTGVEINKKVFSLTEHSAALSKKLKYLRLGEFIAELPGKPHIRNLYGDAAFESLEQSLAMLPLEQLKAIYFYHATRHHLDDAYPEFRQKMTEFFAKQFGKAPERPDRQERCTTEITEKFAMELDSILMPKLFPNFPREKVAAMVEKIRIGLLHSIEKNKWLSASSRVAALQKLKHLNIRLVAPEADTEWNFNEPGAYSDTAPLENRLLYGRLKMKKWLKNGAMTFDNPVWPLSPLEMNAALLPPYNAIIFPAAFFQPPFFDLEASEEVNMAALGTVIGHELGHAIDDKGTTFDYRGRKNPWLKKGDEKKFFARAQPLVEQFERAGQNGKFTLGENIGDLVGLTNAYAVAFPDGSEKPLEMKKAFFKQYARMWCEVQTPEIIELRKKIDPHSLGVARVNEQMKQQPAFAQAFACQKTDPMVLPKEKLVQIW